MRLKHLIPLAAMTATIVLGLASPAQAAAITERDLHFDSVTAGCGEAIHLSGSLLFVGHATASASGGLVASFHFQPQGVTGVGLTSGRTYRGTGVTRETVVFTPRGGMTDTYVNRFHLVATAGGPTYDLRVLSHVTISASGAVTANLYRISVSC